MENRTTQRTDMPLRACRDYHPSDHLTRITYREDGQPDRPALYLDVCNRTAWFNRYCEEKGCTGWPTRMPFPFRKKTRIVCPGDLPRSRIG